MGIRSRLRPGDQMRAWCDLFGMARHGGDVVTGGERLVHDLTARRASGAEYDDPHGVLRSPAKRIIHAYKNYKPHFRVPDRIGF